MKKQFLECGKIVSTHGVRGEVKIMPWCDGPEYLLALAALYLDKGGTSLQVEGARAHKGMVIAKFQGVDNLDDGARFRGKVVYMDRADDPTRDEDGYFVQDLLGMAVVDADSGVGYGELTDVFSTGANDVYEVTDSGGVKRLVPAIPQVVLDIDEENGVMSIRPLKGLFDDAD